ncbi:FCD domain-containing protein [Amycolatopsis sp. FU40]|uniref:FadR/GntR family transcriptional regulator n=1 Tax=Amycolatopsis sp. FU40 TaxID=2914159 RepID=UPI001F3CDCFB|nr:FCD domain-containing protein [Amycolatopsis sp. FU40]UKD59199.1 FCD domain-containing protein [Amycolatopsis sp. FU40]
MEAVQSFGQRGGEFGVSESRGDRGLWADDRLPSERALSESLQVIGASGGAKISDRLGPTISRLMRPYAALGHFDLEDVLHTRRLLEEETARVAAAERTDEQLARLETLLGQIDAADADGGTYLALDGKFHVAVALARGNPLLPHLMCSVRDAVTEHLVNGNRPARWPKLASSAQKSHRAQRDAATAAERVRRHKAFSAAAAVCNYHVSLEALGPRVAKRTRWPTVPLAHVSRTRPLYRRDHAFFDRARRSRSVQFAVRKQRFSGHSRRTLAGLLGAGTAGVCVRRQGPSAATLGWSEFRPRRSSPASFTLARRRDPVRADCGPTSGCGRTAIGSAVQSGKLTPRSARSIAAYFSNICF